MGLYSSGSNAYRYLYALIGNFLWAQIVWDSLRLPAPPVYIPFTAESLPPLPVYRYQKPTLIWNFPPTLDSVYQAIKEKQYAEAFISGFRIQVFSALQRSLADSVKFYLLENYPQWPVYFVYEMPLYKVRVGDFLDRKVAQAVCDELRKEFPAAFVVPDKIPKP